MNYEALVAKYNGQVINDYGGECVALVAHYCIDNGKPIAYANAKDWWMHPALTGSFDFVTNNPNDYNQVPPRGAIMIYSGSLPGSGGFGHIEVFDAVVSPGVFRSLSNNWGGRYVHFVTHNWSYILGWMVPKTSAPAPTPSGGGEIMDNDDKIKRQYNTLRGSEGTPAERAAWLNKPYDQFNQTAIPEINAREQAKKDMATQIQNQTNLINQLNQTITDASGNLTSTKAEKDAAIQKVAELVAQLTTETDKLKDAQKQIDDLKNQTVPVQDDSVSAFNKLKDFVRKLLGIK